MRTGIILAAGFGSRLAGSHNETRLKPLTPVAGKPLLIRTLNSLEMAACHNVIVVVGYGGEEVKKALNEFYSGPLSVDFVFNPHYEKQNGLSLLAAKDHVSNDFVLTMADHVFSDDIMKLAAVHQPPDEGATLFVDYNIEDVFDLDDATKVYVDEKERVVRIGKQLEKFNCIDTGLFIGTQGMIEAGNSLFKEKGDASLSEIVEALAGKKKMNTKDIKESFWQDVDTPEMLAYAEQQLMA
ncbi:NTP transferase domain-containing protein [Balneolaceae bacterium ANBcel3]|nr:NTP transferase domain-containing protein [Balneolaceae bacterium ANBcel3]